MLSDNLFIVSTLNQYGLEVRRLYEGYDQELALKAYYEVVDEGCAARVLECVPKGFRTLRLHQNSDVHTAQEALNDLFDSIPTLKGGGL